MGKKQAQHAVRFPQLAHIVIGRVFATCIVNVRDVL
jgi:hypothetical protein